MAMKVVSVNRGERKLVQWKNSEVETGIFKYPVDEPIMLGPTDVELDAVVDRKYHGGIDKAVYSYSVDHYDFWKQQFPKLEWDFGMFGENLSIEGLDESKLRIGNVYEVGEAKIEVAQPRQPCFKLGIRFNTQTILKPFMNSSFCGVYFRVLTPGAVKVGDRLNLIVEQLESPTIAEVYSLLYQKQQESNSLTLKAIECPFLPESVKASILQTQT